MNRHRIDKICNSKKTTFEQMRANISKFINNIGFKFAKIIFSKEYDKFNKINGYLVYGAYGGITWSKNSFILNYMDSNESFNLYKKIDPVDKMDIACFYHDFCIEFSKNRSEIVESHKMLIRNTVELNQLNIFLKIYIYSSSWIQLYIYAYFYNRGGIEYSNPKIDNIKKLAFIPIKKSDDYEVLLKKIKSEFN
jgi:hypothetical protein